MKHVVAIIILLCNLFSYELHSQKVSNSKFIFKISSHTCSCDNLNKKNQIRNQVAIKIYNRPGLYTSLHGIVDCMNLIVYDTDNEIFPDFIIKEIDIDNDIAYLEPSSINSQDNFSTKYLNKGFHYDIFNQYINSTVIVRPFSKTSNAKLPIVRYINEEDSLSKYCSYLLSEKNIVLLKQYQDFIKRGSPSLNTKVYFFNDYNEFKKEYSGSPVILAKYQNKKLIETDTIISIINNGLPNNDLYWSIPYNNISLEAFNYDNDKVKHILKYCPPIEMFNYEMIVDSNINIPNNPIKEGLYILRFKNKDDDLKNRLNTIKRKIERKRNFRKYPFSTYFLLSSIYYYNNTGGVNMAEIYFDKLKEIQYLKNVKKRDYDLFFNYGFNFSDIATLEINIKNKLLYKSLINSSRDNLFNNFYRNSIEYASRAIEVKDNFDTRSNLDYIRKAIGEKYNNKLQEIQSLLNQGNINYVILEINDALKLFPDSIGLINLCDSIKHLNDHNFDSQIKYDKITTENNIYNVFSNAEDSILKVYNIPKLILPNREININYDDKFNKLHINLKYGMNAFSKDDNNKIINLIYNNFSPGDYKNEGAYIILNMFRCSLDKIVNKYNIQSEMILVNIKGNSDGIKFRYPHEYENEYGYIDFQSYNIKKSECNKQLALLRALYAFVQLKNSDYINNSNCTLDYEEHEEEDGKYRGVDINIEISNYYNNSGVLKLNNH